MINLVTTKLLTQNCCDKSPWLLVGSVPFSLQWRWKWSTWFGQGADSTMQYYHDIVDDGISLFSHVHFGAFRGLPKLWDNSITDLKLTVIMKCILYHADRVCLLYTYSCLTLNVLH